MRRLPPLNGLRAFEAAARARSFQHAAAELSVTPSAVSHQMRTLEGWFGRALFRRAGRGVELTEAGQVLQAAVGAALDRIEEAARAVCDEARPGLLTVSSAPTFAAGWLVGHLSEFQHDYPEIDVRLTTAVAFHDFSGIDLAIAYGAGTWTGVRSHRLMTEQLVPVCSPALLAPQGPLAEPADIARATLLHALPRIGQWRHWMEVAGVSGIDAERGPKFQTTPLALEAAMAGAGVAIANPRFVERHLESGELVVPFRVDLPSEAGYYLLYPEARASHPPVAAFRDWVLAKLASDRGGISEPLPALGG